MLPSKRALNALIWTFVRRPFWPPGQAHAGQGFPDVGRSAPVDCSPTSTCLKEVQHHTRFTPMVALCYMGGKNVRPKFQGRVVMAASLERGRPGTSAQKKHSQRMAPLYRAKNVVRARQTQQGNKNTAEGGGRSGARSAVDPRPIRGPICGRSGGRGVGSSYPTGPQKKAPQRIHK